MRESRQQARSKGIEAAILSRTIKIQRDLKMNKSKLNNQLAQCILDAA
jgi:peptidyl-tRNA hydrolase